MLVPGAELAVHTGPAHILAPDVDARTRWRLGGFERAAVDAVGDPVILPEDVVVTIGRRGDGGAARAICGGWWRVVSATRGLSVRPALPACRLSLAPAAPRGSVWSASRSPMALVRDGHVILLRKREEVDELADIEHIHVGIILVLAGHGPDGAA